MLWDDVHSPTIYLHLNCPLSTEPSNTLTLQCLLKSADSTGPNSNVSSSGQNYTSCLPIFTACSSASVCLGLHLAVQYQVSSLGRNHCGPQYEWSVPVLEWNKVRNLPRICIWAPQEAGLSLNCFFSDIMAVFQHRLVHTKHWSLSRLRMCIIQFIQSKSLAL